MYVKLYCTFPFIILLQEKADCSKLAPVSIKKEVSPPAVKVEEKDKEDPKMLDVFIPLNDCKSVKKKYETLLKVGLLSFKFFT